MAKIFDNDTLNDIRTENGMPTHSTSGNAVLDMFYKMGASRQLSVAEITSMFSGAFYENPNLAVKALFYNGDVREGQKERRSFRIMFRWLCLNNPVTAAKLLPYVPFYARWDSVLVAMDTPVETEAVNLIRLGLGQKQALCAKWMPREHKSDHYLAVKLANSLGDNFMSEWLITNTDINPRKVAHMKSAQLYRSVLAALSDTVEDKMCANEWEDIVFDHIPSVAASRMQKTLWRRLPEQYGEYVAALKTGGISKQTGKVAKVNAGAIFPHDIALPYLKNPYSGENIVVEEQWNTQPATIIDPSVCYIPILDVSGSMYSWESSRIGPNLYAGDVGTALAILAAERNPSVFKDGVISFSANAEFAYLKGSLCKRIRTMRGMNCGGNTNLESVFRLILGTARQHKLAKSDMPTHVLIMSDMQFDEAVSRPNKNALASIKAMYRDYGYEAPAVIFWNLAAKSGVPAKANEHGVALVSGFSPSVLSSLFGGDISPMKMMLKVLNSERYEVIEA